MLKKNIMPESKPVKMPRGKLIIYIVLAVISILIIGSALFVIFPDIYLNRLIKENIISEYKKENPRHNFKINTLNYNIFRNLLEIDSLDIFSNDKKFHLNINEVSLDGINRLALLFNSSDIGKIISDSKLKSGNLYLKDDKYKLEAAQIEISVPDSTLLAEKISYRPVSEDKVYFEEMKFKITRYNIKIAKCKLAGADFSEMLKGESYQIRSMVCDTINTDIKLNTDRKSNPKEPKPEMPNELLYKMKTQLNIDSLKINNGNIIYNEQVIEDSKPGILTFDRLNILVLGITNRKENNKFIVLKSEGYFMNSGKMTVNLKMPVGNPDLTFNYDGSLGKMELSKLNKFLIIAENIKITEGDVYKGTFNIKVNKGIASGIVNLDYKDLYIAFLDKKTQSESGFGPKSKTIIANLLKFKGTNMKEYIGDYKTGKVEYRKKPDEAFMKFIWPALRSGIGDIIGFSNE